MLGSISDCRLDGRERGRNDCLNRCCSKEILKLKRSDATWTRPKQARPGNDEQGAPDPLSVCSWTPHVESLPYWFWNYMDADATPKRTPATETGPSSQAERPLRRTHRKVVHGESDRYPLHNLEIKSLQRRSPKVTVVSSSSCSSQSVKYLPIRSGQAAHDAVVPGTLDPVRARYPMLVLCGLT